MSRSTSKRWRRETSLGPSVKVILLTVPRRRFFCGSFLLFMFRVCLVFLSVLWSPAVKGLTSWLFLFDVLLSFCHFPNWYPGSGVVLDCIDS